MSATDPRVTSIVRELRRLSPEALTEVARELRAIRGLSVLDEINELVQLRTRGSLPGEESFPSHDLLALERIRQALWTRDRDRLRGTGRTTRMLQRALAAARQGESVVVVAATEGEATRLQYVAVGALPDWKEIPGEEHAAIYARMRFLSEAQHARYRLGRRNEHTFFDHTCNRPEFEGPAPTLNGLNPLERRPTRPCSATSLEHWTCATCQRPFRATIVDVNSSMGRCTNCYRDYVNSMPGHGAG